MTIVKRGISGQRYKQLTRLVLFKDSYCLNLQRALSKRLTLSAVLTLSLKAGVYTFTSCRLKKIIEIGFPELGKGFLQRLRSFSVK